MVSSHFWRRTDPDGFGPRPGPRAAHSCDVLGGKMFVFGGWNGKKALNDLYVLDVAKLVWTHVKPQNPPEERNNHTTAVVGFRLFAHGGHDGFKWLDDLHVLDAEPGAVHSRYDDLVWSKPRINGNAPSARACHTLTRTWRPLLGSNRNRLELHPRLAMRTP